MVPPCSQPRPSICCFATLRSYPLRPCSGQASTGSGRSSGCLAVGLIAGLYVAVPVILRRAPPCHSERSEESAERFFGASRLRMTDGEEEQTATASEVVQRPCRRIVWSRAPPLTGKRSSPQPFQEPASAGFHPVALDFSPAPPPFTLSSILPQPAGGSFLSVARDFSPAPDLRTQTSKPPSPDPRNHRR